MAALVEQPPPEILKTPEAETKKSVDDDLSLKVGEVIQIKEAKLNVHGVLEINNPTGNPTEKVETEVIRHESDPRIDKNKEKQSESKPEQEVASRPVTGVSIRSHKRNDDSASRSSASLKEEETAFKEKDRVKSSGLSITVGRKPLHNTPASRLSENYAKFPIRATFPLATPGRGTLDQFPLPRGSEKTKHRHGQARLVRLATVSLSAR